MTCANVCVLPKCSSILYNKSIINYIMPIVCLKTCILVLTQTRMLCAFTKLID